MEFKHFMVDFKRLDLSTRPSSALRKSAALRSSNTMLSHHSFRNTRQNRQQCNSPRSAALTTPMAVGSASGSASPEDQPLTVSRAQRRPAQRRCIVDSDDELDASASCSKSPRRQVAARLPVITPKSQRAIQNLMNLLTLGPECVDTSTDQQMNIHIKGQGKPGILELAILLRPEEIQTNADGDTYTSAVAAASAETPAAQPCEIGSAVNNDSESPLVLTRTIRAPRTGRPASLDYGSDSDDGDRPLPQSSDGSAPGLVSFKAAPAQGDCMHTPPQALPDDSVLTPAVERIRGLSSSSHSSASSFYSANSEDTHDLCVIAGEAGFSQGATNTSKAVLSRADQELKQQPRTLTQSPGTLPGSGLDHMGVSHATADVHIGAETARAVHSVSESQLDARHLVKVPRRRQGQRDGGHDVGPSALGPSTSRMDCDSELADNGLGGLMYDLCGELQLLSQLRDLYISSKASLDTDDDTSQAGDVPDGSPAPPCALPVRTRTPEVMDLTWMSSSSSSSSGGGGSDIHILSSTVSDSPLHGVADATDELPPVGRSSPAGLLDAYQQARPEAMGKAEALQNPGPSSIAAEMNTTDARSDILLGYRSPVEVRWPLDSGAEGQIHVENSGSDAETRFEIPCKRPPTTGRRRAVVFDSSSEEGSPQQHSTLPAGRLIDAGAEEAISALTGLTISDDAIRQQTVGPGGAFRATTDPYDLSGRSTASNSSSVASDSDAENLDCALETPLPWFAARIGTPNPAGRPVDTKRPPFATLPPSLRGLQTDLVGAFTTTERKGQMDRDGMAFPGVPEAPSQEGSVVDGVKDTTRRKPSATTGGRGANAAAAQRAFLATRAQLARELYSKWNAEVFGGHLPSDLPLVWNSRLTSTAGQVVSERKAPGIMGCVAAKLELSPRLVDSVEKLRNTLSHEMCHVAAWHISHEYNRPHGPSWEGWAQRFIRYDPSLVITRTHQYTIQFAHRWRCTNVACGKEYGRQRQTIRVGVHVCAVCRSQLEYLGNFDKRGNLKAPKRATAAAGGTPGSTAGVAGGRMPGSTSSKPLSEFAKFCKENFRSVQTSMPARTPASAVFKHMGLLYQKHKAGLTLTGGVGGGAAPGLSTSGPGLAPEAMHPFLSPRERNGARKLRGKNGDSGGRVRHADGSASPSRRSPAGRLAQAEAGELRIRLDGLSLTDKAED